MTEASQRQPVRAVRGPSSAPGWLAPERDYPAVMGILNVTPNSFSDGGKFLDPKRAIAQAERMIADGADIIDIGAESTRPYGGQLPVSADEEISRLRPVLKDIVALGTPVSIDTMKPLVARFALDAGASIVNDVWGLQHDGEMARIVADLRGPGGRDAQSRDNRSGHRHHGGYRRFLRTHAGDRRQGRDCARDGSFSTPALASARTPRKA